MKNKKICVVDYIGNAYEGKAIGHPTKVIKQFFDILHEEYKVHMLLPEIYREEFEIGYKLNCYCDIKKKLKNKKLNFLKNKINNLKQVFDLKEEFLIFVNTDIVIYLVLPFLKKNQKVIIVNYCDYKSMVGVTGKIKKMIYKLGSKYIDLELNTYNINSDNYIPDYFCNENDLNLEDEFNKKKGYLIIGTMNESKDIEGVVNIFKNSNDKLKIIGKFYSEEYYKRIKNLSKDCNNIKVIDKYLTDEEYSIEIEKCKYVILPYNTEIYKNITSGVFLDTIYKNKIVIVPKTKYFSQFDSKNLCITYNNLSEMKENIEDKNIEDIMKNIKKFKAENTIKNISRRIISNLEVMDGDKR